MALQKPSYKVVLREGAETEYGTPTPVLIIDIAEEAHSRLGLALVHRLASGIEMESMREGWSVVVPSGISLMGTGHPLRAVIKLELDHGTIEEARRGVEVLGRVAYAMSTDKWVAVEFQGAALGPVKTEPAARVSRKGGR